MEVITKICIVLLVAMFVGCGGGPVIDGSSDEAFKESLEKVRASLEPEQATEFDKALMVVGFNSMGVLFSNPTSPEEMMVKMKKDLDGKNAKQVIEMAKEIRSEKKK